MRINFVDVVCDGSLKNTVLDGIVTGCQFDIRLSYYRGQFLSVIDQFEVKIDGLEIAQERLSLSINERVFGFCELKECYTEFWNILDPATVIIEMPGGLAPGAYAVDVTLYFRSPYMETGPHQYMTIDSCGSKTLPLAERQEAYNG